MIGTVSGLGSTPVAFGDFIGKGPAATHFVVSAPGSATPGTAFSFTVTAVDQFGNTAFLLLALGLAAIAVRTLRLEPVRAR